MTGAGALVGVDNGSEINHESFKADAHTTFNGLCLAVIESGGKKGKITITATSDGLPTVSTTVDAEPK